MNRTCFLKAGIISNSLSNPYKAKQTLKRLNFEILHFFKNMFYGENLIIRLSKYNISLRVSSSPILVCAFLKRPED